MPADRRRDRILTAASLALLRASRAPQEGAPPLFIVGSGRSGNTLVRRVLMASGAIYIPPETYVLGEIIETWQRGALLPWRERVWLYCAYFERHREFPTFGLENLGDFAGEAIALPRARQTLRDLTDTFYRHLARAHGSKATRWGDKTPYNTYFLPAISALFPQAQFLWLVRDGRDVALSYVQAGFYPDLATAARRWCEANDACAAFAKGRHDVRRLAYEDLVSDPEPQFRALFDWAGLPFEPAMLTADTGRMGDVEARAHHSNVTKPISAGSVGRWREHVDAAELASLPATFWDAMTAQGYDTDGR